MTLAELYEALGALDKGSEYISCIKSEISRLNTEAAKYRTSKKESESKIEELNAKVTELTQKGTGDQSELSKLKAQVDEISKKYAAAEKARIDEQQKRIKADILQQTVSELTKGNATDPSELAKILVQGIEVGEDGAYNMTNEKGEKISISDGTKAWLSKHAWAVKNTQSRGSGGFNGEGEILKPQNLAQAVAQAINK